MSYRDTARGPLRERCRTRLHGGLIIALLAAIPTMPALAQETAQSIEFNIAAQLLESALVEFGAQASVQVAAADADVSGLKTAGVTGRRAVEEALAQLLRGTGLEYRKISPRTYRVSRPYEGGSGDARPAATPNQTHAAGASSGIAPQGISPPPPAGSVLRQISSQGESDASSFEEVLVTGTHIRGSAPTGANLIVIDRADFERGGFATAQDAIRALPQNFGGGPSEDTMLGTEAQTNGAFATAINLRGLGAASTLVLLNGRRLAPGGTEGNFTDVSSVPLAAIERIEVLPDGASAAYGSDAVGGVVNFHTRKSLSGLETLARYGYATSGGIPEYQFGQALGGSWGTGGGLLAYEFYKRDNVPARERAFTASSDLRPYGGSNFDTPNDNPGTVFSGTQTWAIPRGQDGTALTPSSFTLGTRNLGNRNEGRDLIAEQRRHSIYGAVNHDLGNRASLSSDMLFSTRRAQGLGPGLAINLTVPNTNAFYVNPTGGTGPVRINYNFIDDLGPRLTDVDVDTYNGGLGLSLALPRQWQLKVSGAYMNEDVEQVADFFLQAALNAALADSNRATAFNPFGDGSFTNPATIAGLRGNTLFTSQSEQWSATLAADGALWSLAGGEARLAVGAEFRKQTFDSFLRLPTPLERTVAFEREVKSAFAELRVPIVGDGNALPALRSLTLSVAGRHEDYADFGSATTPKVGVVWSPLSALTIRGTWGESFRAPNLPDLDETNNTSSIAVLADPLSPIGTSSALRWFGKNAELSQETAESHTVGIELAPVRVPKLRLALTYFDISFHDRIQSPPSTSTYLQEQQFADLVTRNPTAEQREVVCSRSTFNGNAADCRNLPIAAIVDLRINNTAITKNRGFDLLADYGWSTPVGNFVTNLSGTYVMDFQQAQLRSSPLLELADTARNPLKLRFRGAVSWSRGGLGSTVFVNYADSYQDIQSVPNRPIDSWTTIDLQLSYDTEAFDGGLLDDSRVALNVQNVLNEDPPFYNNSVGVGYDQENADVLGRFVSLQIRKSW